MNKAKKFPNGFESWRETHFEVTSVITGHMRKKKLPPFLAELQSEHGHTEMYNLSEEITDAFEKKNKGREWDGEFYDEVEKFTEDWIKKGGNE